MTHVRAAAILIILSMLLGSLACERDDPVRPGGSVDSQTEAVTDPPSADRAMDSEVSVEYELVRFCTFNIEDLRYDDIMAALRGEADEAAERVRSAARLVATLDPDVLLVNELEYDQISAEPLSGEAFAQLIRRERAELAMPDRVYQVFQRPSNTGIPSGFDLDRNGEVVFAPGSRAYGGDAFGYGEFPGHYAMALFVASPLSIDTEQARTFQHFLWKDMPDALLPMGDGERVPEDEPWYTEEMLEVFRLSSKSHWDVPVIMPDGSRVRVLASHPTPPVFDGPENRNGRRNHDEIRFWGEYLSGADWIVDDEGGSGGHLGGPFVIMGDLNADPKAGDSLDDPVGRWLLKHPLVNGYFVPTSGVRLAIGDRKLTQEATAEFGLRVDYVLASKGLVIARGGMVRGEADLPSYEDLAPDALASIRYESSDHFPVWIDIQFPSASK